MDKWGNYFDDLLNDRNNDNNYDTYHYQQVINSLRCMEEESVSSTEQNGLDMLNRDITFAEVKTAVKNAKNRKATGPDHIPAEVLKNDVSINALYSLVSCCFKNSIVTDQWQTGIITPIFKEGDKTDPQNYRGITLLNASCKIYCDILNCRLMKWLEQNEKLCDEQNGFRANRSCQDHIYALYSLLKSRLSLKLSTYTCFVDARKAFDRVNRTCLWYKLQSLGIKGNMYNAIKSLYTDVKCYVKLNGTHITRMFSIIQGVKQGCKLSPTLFSIYINDLANELKEINKGVQFGNCNISLLMFADDIVLLAQSAEDLQQMLNVLSSWCSKWRLELNLEKTKIIHFRLKSTKQTVFPFMYCNQPVLVINRYKYLGLWFDEYLHLDVMVKEVAKAATRALGAVIAKVKCQGGMTYQCFTRLYESLVEPVLLYGAAIWGYKDHGLINTVQNKAARFFLGVSPRSPNMAIIGDIGWTTVKGKQYIEIARFWLRLRSFNPLRITSKIFKWSLRLANVYKKHNYEYQVRQLFTKLNCQSFCSYEEPNNVSSSLRIFKDSVNAYQNKHWLKTIWNDTNNPNGNKLRHYRHYKRSIVIEKYVETNVPRFKKRYFAMLRAGSLPLSVETGRYTKPKTPLNERLCEMCSMQCVEDEKHFLLTCNLYSDIREAMIEKAGLMNANFLTFSYDEQFNYLMSEPKMAYTVSIAVFKMFSRRKIFI